jgi:uncharacterized protein (DUF1697 family)
LKTEPHILLLRGINLGNNRIPMPELVKVVEGAGATDAKTYIASGNVVCRADPATIGALCRKVHDVVEARFGFRSPVVARSLPEWREMMAHNPFDSVDDDKKLYVMFLADLPTPGRLAALDPDHSPGDRFVVRGRDLYLHIPRGAAETKITNAWLDRTLATVSTGRNWRTVRTLGEMAEKLVR